MNTLLITPPARTPSAPTRRACEAACLLGLSLDDPDPCAPSTESLSLALAPGAIALLSAPGSAGEGVATATDEGSFSPHPFPLPSSLNSSLPLRVPPSSSVFNPSSSPPSAPPSLRASVPSLSLSPHPPTTPALLHSWLFNVLSLTIPRAPLIPSNSAAFDYLCHAFFEPDPTESAVPLVGCSEPTSASVFHTGADTTRSRAAPLVDRSGSTSAPRSLAPSHWLTEEPSTSATIPTHSPRDSVIWAARGSGKTFLAALATLLDLLFKPGIEVRILAGSLEQGRRMHAHLRRLLLAPPIAPLARAHVTDRRVTLASGSIAEILAASETSVRGVRPQKLRCDEVELFDPDLWAAAQLTTRSVTLADGRRITGAVEAFSTMHRPHGLMARIVEECSGPRPARRLFRWGVIDALERCPPTRACDSCALLPECAGRAKHAEGHVPIDDAITLKARSSQASWESEMLCARPTRDRLVLPGFDRSIHVVECDPPQSGVWLAGLDFGFRAPAALLWAHLDDALVLRIVDERIISGATIASHVEAIRSARWPIPKWIAADPAGAASSDQTGHSSITALRQASLVVRHRRSGVEEGLELIRARLTPATGAPRLFVHARCARLLRALETYHYDDSPAGVPTPAKDGPDHAIDALRYLITCLDRPWRFHQYSYT